MSDNSSFSEKRQQVRHPASHGVQVKVLPDAESVSPHVINFECKSRDLSPAGIRLHGNFGLEADSIVHLTVNDDEARYSLVGQVVWSTETTEHEHLCGLSLTNSPSSDLDKWQARFQ